MITYRRGNLLEAKTQAIVNTVNEVGVMGKGIALQVREAFPDSARDYMRAAKSGEVHVGHVLVTRNHGMMGPKWIIHFPTKRHWRQPSRIEWVREGLSDLVRVVQELHIESIALPPLGCGNGGLDWHQVKPLIDDAFADLPGVEVLVFEPAPGFQTAAKAAGVKKLTPARALIAELVRRYSVGGMGCSNLEIQKLAWFLQRVLMASRLKNPLRLTFNANKYGPYADQLRHLLDALDGSYLHSEKRLSEASPHEQIHFRDDKRAEVAEYLATKAPEYLPALDSTSRLIDGFESPLGMELLATVDWLLWHDACEPSVDSVKSALRSWSGGAAAGRRKLELFDERMLALAIERVTEPIDTTSTLGARLC